MGIGAACIPADGTNKSSPTTSLLLLEYIYVVLFESTLAAFSRVHSGDGVV